MFSKAEFINTWFTDHCQFANTVIITVENAILQLQTSFISFQGLNSLYGTLLLALSALRRLMV